MPPSVRGRVPSDSPAALLNDLVNELDLAPFLAVHDEPPGMPPCHPPPMLKILLHGYATGVTRSGEPRVARRRRRGGTAGAVLDFGPT